jgi:hypothetical protein
LEAQLDVRKNFRGTGTAVDYLLSGTMAYLVHRKDNYKDQDLAQLEHMHRMLEMFHQQETAQMAQLQTAINALQQKIDAMFDEMKEHPYKLFAVWVHAGVAGSGHYWAYIRDIKSGKWQKFNDIFVNEVRILHIPPWMNKSCLKWFWLVFFFFFFFFFCFFCFVFCFVFFFCMRKLFLL